MSPSRINSIQRNSLRLPGEVKNSKAKYRTHHVLSVLSAFACRRHSTVRHPIDARIATLRTAYRLPFRIAMGHWSHMSKITPVNGNPANTQRSIALHLWTFYCASANRFRAENNNFISIFPVDRLRILLVFPIKFTMTTVSVRCILTCWSIRKPVISIASPSRAQSAASSEFAFRAFHAAPTRGVATSAETSRFFGGVLVSGQSVMCFPRIARSTNLKSCTIFESISNFHRLQSVRNH